MGGSWPGRAVERRLPVIGRRKEAVKRRIRGRSAGCALARTVVKLSHFSATSWDVERGRGLTTSTCSGRAGETPAFFAVFPPTLPIALQKKVRPEIGGMWCPRPASRRLPPRTRTQTASALPDTGPVRAQATFHKISPVSPL